MEGSDQQQDMPPGKVCAKSGVYEAIHQAHRAAHNVVVRKGELFPRCNGCGDAVRFRLVGGHGENKEQPQRKRARKKSAGR